MSKTTKLIVAGAMLAGGVYLCGKNKEELKSTFSSKKSLTTDTTDGGSDNQGTQGVSGIYCTDQIIAEEMNAVYHRRTF